MQFSLLTIAGLAATAAANPQIGGILGGNNGASANTGVLPAYPGDITVQQAGDACGNDLELTCCNDYDIGNSANNVASGLLAGLLGGAVPGAGLFNQCSKLSVTAVIGVSDLLNDQCKQTVACCQHSGSDQTGLVNAGLPCVALGGLL